LDNIYKKQKGYYNMKKKYIIFICITLILGGIIFVQAQSNVVDLREIVGNWKLESNGGAPVNIQDQTTPPLDIFFVQLNGSITTLAEDSFIDNQTINVTNRSASGIDVGTYLGLSGVNGGRFYFGEVLSVSGDLVTLDTPLDFNYTANANVVPTTRDLNVDGSLTPQIFFVGVGGAGSDLEFDITRIMIKCITDTAPTLDRFCDQTSLTNGIILRRVDGDARNIWNVKNNGELGHLAYDYQPYLATNPGQTQNGALFRYSFAGQDKHGVAVRIKPGDELQIIIQDDLSGIDLFRVVAEGHITTN
jgi:hypothetical protein